MKELRARFEATSGVQNIPIEDLLSPTFMSKHTNFNSFAQMVEQAGYHPEEQEDWDTLLASEDRTTFVHNNTLFSGWDDLLSSAATERIVEQLGLQSND